MCTDKLTCDASTHRMDFVFELVRENGKSHTVEKGKNLHKQTDFYPFLKIVLLKLILWQNWSFFTREKKNKNGTNSLD